MVNNAIRVTGYDGRDLGASAAEERADFTDFEIAGVQEAD